jgi:hypothetical protein
MKFLLVLKKTANQNIVTYQYSVLIGQLLSTGTHFVLKKFCDRKTSIIVTFLSIVD